MSHLGYEDMAARMIERYGFMIIGSRHRYDNGHIIPGFSVEYTNSDIHSVEQPCVIIGEISRGEALDVMRELKLPFSSFIWDAYLYKVTTD